MLLNQTGISSLNIEFKKVSLEHKENILQWLKEPHIQKFWDTSPEHWEDILIFMRGRTESSPYWKGIFDYWIGFIDHDPYCLVTTSEVLSQQELLDSWREHLSKTGKTWSIDFMIGNPKYLGKGLAAPTLEAFTQFVSENYPLVDTFLIDPAASNLRAKHTNEKAGFKTVATFHRDFKEEKAVKHFLMVKKISSDVF